MDDLEDLTADELLALAGLCRAMIRLDARFTEPERAALIEIAHVVASPSAAARDGGGPYREAASPLTPLGEEAFFELIELAGRELPDDASIRAAARGVTRPEAREAIHALLTHLAVSDIAVSAELALLDWLATEWSLPRRR